MAEQAAPGPVQVKRWLVGRPLASGELGETLLPKVLALPIFASDALSSVAYATEAAMVVLLAAGTGALPKVWPISIAVGALLAIVALSYRQTVRAYEQSGGAYVVAKDNLGTLPALVAAAALLTDYVLTVAVSISAGILAITSAVPSLHGVRVELALACVGVLTLANLRGVREAGFLFALPTYGFILAMYALLGTGIARCATGSCPAAHVPQPLPAGAGTLGVFLILKAFASGASALTGVEAIANGVSAFKRPQARNAAATLAIMATIAITLFLGVSWLAVKMHARPSATDSVLSQIADAAFGRGAGYWTVQIFTFAILVLAANTSFQGFPRLAAILAHDRFFPRQFVNLGDRLVYSNGVVVLAGLAAALVAAFGANVNSLIHLYVVGVFTAFTLSQTGMVRLWLRRREPGWRRSAVVNGVGALTTGLVAVVVVETKFLEGAWAVIVFIPLLVAGFYGVKRHYRRVARRLLAGVAAVEAAPPPTNTVVLLVESLDPATARAAWLARRVAASGFHAIHPRGGPQDPRGEWWDWSGGGIVLESLPRDESRTEAVLDYVWGLPRGESHFVSVVVPEQFRKRSLLSALRRTAFTLKLRLLPVPGVAIVDVPMLAAEGDALPVRAVCRVLASGAHAATLRAANYARTLGIEDTRAVFFAFDAEESKRVRREWAARASGVELEVLEAPYRDLGDPLLAYLRAITADPDALAVVVMPELYLTGWRRFLHNQRALYVKRLLLFEPRVVLASVPYQLP